MSVALHGNLRDFGIGEVFQLIGQQQKTGVLEVSDGDVRLRVAFDGGAVVTGERVGAYEQAALGDMLVRTGSITPQRLVELERRIADGGVQLEALLRESGELRSDQLDEVATLVTREALFDLLRWSRGSFHFTAGPVAPARDPRRLIAAEQVLMDGLRMVDEWRSFEPAAVDADAVLAPLGRFEDFRREQSGESPEALAVAERLFLLVDGRLPVRRVTDLSRLGSFEAARWLTRFLRAGLVEQLDPALVAKKQRRLHALAAGPSLFGAVTAVLPWLLLAAVLLGLSQRPLLPPVEAHRLVEQEQLRRTGTAFETLRFRNLADAYRYAKGSWPKGPTDLRRFFHEARRHATLAPLDEREYYFAQRGDSFLVLAPEE